MNTNPPLTFIINILNILNICNNTPNAMIPTNIGAVIAGTIMSQFYPNTLAKRYTMNNKLIVKVGDILFHWFPLIILLKLNKKPIQKKHIISSFILPILYFSFRHNGNIFTFTNPISHIKSIYPDIPLWIFTLYFANPLLICRS